MDTIFALSSGRPPAAIAVLRISGPAALDIGTALAGTLPAPRHAALRTLRDRQGDPLDQALLLLFPAPNSATGEDMVELHLHGGRAVVAAVERAIAASGAARPSRPGEFTRRALANGRIDLTQAQGLADLLAAETEGARRAALAAAEGVLGQALRGWLGRVSRIGAGIEAALDFSDEDDVDARALHQAQADAAILAEELAAILVRPSVERLHEGARVVLAGPPNAGKSSLFNALAGRDAAIVTPLAGTTRDALEAPVTRAGEPYLLVDTAGLRDEAADPVEQIGIARAAEAIARAEALLWLGDPDDAPPEAIRIHARADEAGRAHAPEGSIAVSIHDPASVAALWERIAEHVAPTPSVDGIALREEQRRGVGLMAAELRAAATAADPLIAAEHVRLAAAAGAILLGIDATEAMLDALFSRFCIGK